LVTGGAGYIGSHVTKQLLRETEYDITVLDSCVTGFEETINKLQSIRKFTYINEDLSNWSNIEVIFQNNRFDAIIHFAASLIVPESVENPLKYYLNNTANTSHLVQCCIQNSVNKFIFSSTAAVYGEPDILDVINGVSEKFPTNPINPYGQSKLFSEKIIQDSAQAYKDFKFVILRYFNVAGSDREGLIGQSTLNATHLIKVAVQTALGKREKMIIFGEDYATGDGTCIRDYIHVQDLANAHIFGLNYLNEERKSNIFNVGYGKGFSVKEVINTVKEVSNVDFKVEISEKRAGDPAFLISDNTKLLKEYSKIETDKPLFEYDDLKTICKTALEWEKKL
jgi:UDP-glucose 4-epimerase